MLPLILSRKAWSGKQPYRCGVGGRVRAHAGAGQFFGGMDWSGSGCDCIGWVEGKEVHCGGGGREVFAGLELYSFKRLRVVLQ